jgi:hypothetical protein
MITTIIGTLMAVLLSMSSAVQSTKRSAEVAIPAITVYRVKTCGCCGKWAEHLRQAGFDVTVRIVDDVASVSGRQRVPEQLRTCHVAFLGPYAIEGHVPADVIKDLLKKKPQGIDGLAVPGMPPGSPGMESPSPQRYEILAFDRKGGISVFAKR